MTKSNYAFIDSQNLNLAVRDQGWKLDYLKFRVYLKDKFNVGKAFLFIGYIPANYKLYEALRKDGYELVFKEVVFDRQMVKGNVDAELVLQCMVELNYFSKAVIVSGDGDFLCLIKYLTYYDKLEAVVIPNRRKYSSLLRRYRDKIDFLNFKRAELEYQKSRHNVSGQNPN